MSLTVTRVAQADSAWATRVVPFLETHTDRVRDLLVWADVVSSLGTYSTIWLAEAAEEAVGLAFAFPIWPGLSALGVRGVSPAVEGALLSALVAEGIHDGYVITAPEQVPLYEARGTLTGRRMEHQMVLESASWVPREMPGVRPGRLEELDAFYRRCEAGAWNPVQFETGPYVVREDVGRIVAAAGTHFAYEGLAQVGNVMTDPGCRGRGHGEAVTAAVVQALVGTGVPVVSLFVDTENAGAVRLYERLGFRILRTLAAFRWQAVQPTLFEP